MWKKPWSMKEGYVIGAAIISAGILMQLATGPVEWEAFAWPVNALVLAVLLLAIAVVFLVRHDNYPIHFLTTHRSAVPALVWASALTIVMGLTRQRDGGALFYDMLSFWPFVLIYVYICFLLGLLTLRRISHMVYFHHRHPNGGKRPWLRDIGFILNHGGLFVTLVFATLGNPDMRRLQMNVSTTDTEWRAVDDAQQVVPLSFGIQLKRFILEEYPDGSPKRYASEIIITKANKQRYAATVDVNHPTTFAGWKIYQHGYGILEGSNAEVSVLELVRDPWLRYVYLGIFMLLAGSLLMFFDKSYSAKGVSEEEVRRQREARRKKEEERRLKEKSKRRMAEEFLGEGNHGEHHHHHNDHEHYRAET